MARVRFKSFQMNKNFVQQVEKSTGITEATRKKAEEVKRWAITVFDASARHTHPITPPPYRASFHVARRLGKGWVLYNDDPVAVFVEFGSHPGGGATETLGYRPIGKAVDIVSGRSK